MKGKCTICGKRRTIHRHIWTGYDEKICYDCARRWIKKFSIEQNIKSIRSMLILQEALSRTLEIKLTEKGNGLIIKKPKKEAKKK